MTPLTDPRAFLCELRELDTHIQQLLASPSTVCWHWPSYYLLYVDIDRMAAALHRIGTALGARAGAALPLAPFDAKDARSVDGMFMTYAQLYKSLLRHVWQITRGHSSVVHDKRLRKVLGAHLHPKSAWYRELQVRYQAGQLVLDPEQLGRVILLMDPSTTEDRIDDTDTTRFVQHQLFDLGTHEARHALVQSVRDTEQLHSELNRKMTAFFKQHCSIDALLHPCSV